MKIALIMASPIWKFKGQSTDRPTLKSKCDALEKVHDRTKPKVLVPDDLKAGATKKTKAAGQITEHLIRAWLREGPPRQAGNSKLTQFCAAASQLLDCKLEPDWLSNRDVSVYELGRFMGLQQMLVNHALGHHLLNRDELPAAKQFMQLRKNVDTKFPHPAYGAYILTRTENIDGKHPARQCLLLIGPYLEHEQQGKIAVLATLYVPSLDRFMEHHIYIGSMSENDGALFFYL